MSKNLEYGATILYNERYTFTQKEESDMKKFLSLIIAVLFIISSITVASAATADSFENNYAKVSENSEAVEDYPVITAIDAVKTGLKIQWSEFDNAKKYALYQKTKSGWDFIATTSALSYTHSNLSYYGNYTYTIIALDDNNDVISDYNANGWTHSYLEMPVVKSVTCTTEGMSIKWDHIDGCENYKVYVKTTGSWKAIGFTQNNTFVDTNVKSGTTYTYTVRCVTKDTLHFTSYHTSGKKATYIATPQITKVENTATGTRVTWSKVNGASKYRLFYKVTGGWKTITTTTSSSYVHAPLNNQATFTYTVRALNSKNQYISAYNKTGTKNTFLSVPALKSASSAFGGMKVSWNHVNGAKNYKVYIKTATSWKSIGTTTDNSFLHTSAVSGTSYTYTVRCVDESGKTWQSYFNTKGITGKYVASPVIQNTISTEDGVQITWNKVNGAEKYKVFYKTETKWKTIATTTSDTYTHKPLNDGDTFIYTVRACNSSGSYISGFDSAGCSSKFIAPITLEYSLSDNLPSLSWNSESTAYGYRIYQKTLDGTWASIADCYDNTFIDENPPENTPYTYTMRCIDKDNNVINYYSSETKYYYNGSFADGEISYNGTTYKFDNGNLRQGFVTINNHLYYYNKDGIIEKNKVVGSDKEGYYYADENGICCQSEEMRLAAEYLMTYATGNTTDERLKTGFSYMARNYPYLRSFDHPKKASDMPKQAIDFFTDKAGNCFKYATAFACTAKASGYRARVVVGTTPGYGTWTPHGWTEVYVNGKWLVCDANFQMMYPTPEYYYYMSQSARVPVKASARYEIEIIDGVAVWK